MWLFGEGINLINSELGEEELTSFEHKLKPTNSLSRKNEVKSASGVGTLAQFLVLPQI